MIVCFAASVALFALIVYIPALLKYRKWLFLSFLAYWAVLWIDWPRPVARYLLPGAPLMLAMLYLACRWVADFYAPWSRYLRPVVTIAVVSVILCNVLFAMVEVYVARAHDYYGVFEAGLNESFIDDIAFTRAKNVADAEIAINPVNVSSKNRQNGAYRNRYMRAAVVLADRGIRMIPEELSGQREDDGGVTMLEPTGEPIFKWCKDEHVRYYMYRPPAASFWHFAIGDREAMAWRLYEVTPQGFEQIKPPHIPDWPRRMPGIE